MANKYCKSYMNRDALYVSIMLVCFSCHWTSVCHWSAVHSNWETHNLIQSVQSRHMFHITVTNTASLSLFSLPFILISLFLIGWWEWKYRNVFDVLHIFPSVACVSLRIKWAPLPPTNPSVLRPSSFCVCLSREDCDYIIALVSKAQEEFNSNEVDVIYWNHIHICVDGMRLVPHCTSCRPTGNSWLVSKHFNGQWGLMACEIGLSCEVKHLVCSFFLSSCMFCYLLVCLFLSFFFLSFSYCIYSLCFQHLPIHFKNQKL